MFKSLLVTSAFLALISNSFALSTKSDFKAAIDAADLESIIKVELSLDQPAMLGLVSLDCEGLIGREVYTQKIYIHSAEENSKVSKKFKPRIQQ